ncbi:MAG TPA: hypothetical protein VLH38_04890 [Patescibacteria group bacterium]|nr:hypothetical protein [Patescibacteria group bacterium]
MERQEQSQPLSLGAVEIARRSEFISVPLTENQQRVAKCIGCNLARRAGAGVDERIYVTSDEIRICVGLPESTFRGSTTELVNRGLLQKETEASEEDRKRVYPWRIKKIVYWPTDTDGKSFFIPRRAERCNRGISSDPQKDPVHERTALITPKGVDEGVFTKICEVYPDQHQKTIIRNLQALLKRGILQQKNITNQRLTPQTPLMQHVLRMALRYQTPDAETRYLIFNPVVLHNTSILECQAIAHCLGLDILLLGKRLTATSLKQALSLRPVDDLGVYARQRLARLEQLLKGAENEKWRE